MAKRVILKSRFRDPNGREAVIYSDVEVDDDALSSAREKPGMARTGIMSMCRGNRGRMLQQRGIATDGMTFVEEWAVEREESSPLAW